ncbi:hypothetical protein BGW80DRAFT_1300417, partial [Lactifluus volemus]
MLIRVLRDRRERPHVSQRIRKTNRSSENVIVNGGLTGRVAKLRQQSSLLELIIIPVPSSDTNHFHHQHNHLNQHQH